MKISTYTLHFFQKSLRRVTRQQLAQIISDSSHPKAKMTFQCHLTHPWFNILLHCLIAGRASEYAGGRDHRKATGGEVEDIRTGTETQHQSAVQLWNDLTAYL
jgi:hypothetical protein